MARQLDKVVVVDIESTCWQGAPRPGQVSDIIEVGACLLDPVTGERTAKDRVLVRPTRSTVSAFCTRLTGLTAAEVATGVALMDAGAWLRKAYLSERRPWASWGDYDRRQFERQCGDLGVKYPFGPTHINVKALFGLVRGAPRECGMDDALRALGMTLEGRHHCGMDDAWNIAKILGHLLSPGGR